MGVAVRGRKTIAALRDVWDRLRRRPPRPRSLRLNDWTIEQVERAIRNQPVEWDYVFDQSGVQVVRRRGTETTLVFSADDLHLMEGSCLIHNHPPNPDVRAENLTFSPVDLVFAVRYNLAEARVVAADWRFVIRRPEEGWPADEDMVLAVYNETRDEVNRAFIVAVAEGRMKEDERQAALPHETLRRVAQWGRFTYRREHLPWR